MKSNSIKIGMFRVSMSPHGVSQTFGGRRFYVTTTPDGRRHVKVRLPGGLRVGKTFGKKRARRHD
ncbi:DUF4236 domain-containing protein [Nonomuraea sp. NPDC048916]|uniref:DUF4236 domain-containing protein n=1 Tax=Nonomuraea sp. NPDC048916 TaxID=3154232 RepID=UPI0033C8EC38